MNKNIKKLIDEIKFQIEEKVISIIGQKKSISFRGKTIKLITWCDYDDQPMLDEFKVRKIFVRDNQVLIEIEDCDHDKEELYLHGLGLGEIQSVLELL